MGGYHPPVRKEIKDEIVSKIKEGSIRVPEASRQYGISDNTIYGWFAKRTAEPGTLELARLKRQNQGLLELVGRLTLEIEKSKKNQRSR